MKLLKSKRGWLLWNREEGFYINDPPPAPKEFPCYVYTIVTNWGMEESEPIYIYKADLERMLGNCVHNQSVQPTSKLGG